MGSSSSKSSGGFCGDCSCTALVAYDERAAAGARVHHCSDFVSPDALVPHLQPGDIVQCKGDWIFSVGLFYSHFAVYIGNGEVVHVAMNETKREGKARIERQQLVEAFRGRLVRKANLQDELGVLKAKTAREIIFYARDQVGKLWDYNLITNNCEHFATLCRYGEKRSLQSWGLGDLKEGRIGVGEFLYQSIGRSLRQHCDTFTSWVKRKLKEHFPALAIAN